jgi:hypothetical protein
MALTMRTPWAIVADVPEAGRRAARKRNPLRVPSPAQTATDPGDTRQHQRITGARLNCAGTLPSVDYSHVTQSVLTFH